MILLLGIGATFIAGDAQFLGIGYLNTSFKNSVAYGVSYDGMFVSGYAATTSILDEAVRWSELDGLIGLGTFEPDTSSSAYAISGIDTIAVGDSGNQTCYWTLPNGITEIPTGEWEPSKAFDISADGSTIVGSGGLDAGYFYVIGGSVVGVDPPIGWLTGGSAEGISADASVVVGYGRNATGRSEAYRKFVDFSIEALGTVPSGDPNSRGRDVSADGSVIVGDANGPQAFRWSEGTGMQPLGFRLNCLAVSADGEVMVGSERDLITEKYRAVVWIHGAMFDLRHYLLDNGAQGVFPELVLATDVSADGTVVVGRGVSEGFWCRIPRTLGPHSIRVNIQKPVFGSVTGGDRRSTFASDDQRLEITNGVVPSNSLSPVTWEIEGTAARLAPSKLEFKLEAQVSRSGLSQTIDLWNHQTQSWQTVDTRAATTTDQTVTIERTTDGTQFVRPQDGKVKARIRYKATGPGANSTWKARIDHARWTAHP